MTITELEKDLKEGKLNSIYLLYGEEIFLLESSVKKIKKQFGEIVPGINFIQIDETNLEELISDLQTPAFGYEKKLIIVKNSGLFKKEGKRKNAKLSELKEKVANYIEDNKDDIKEYNIVIFIEDDIEKNALYKKGYNRNINKDLIDEFISKLPFALTKDQLNSVNEITVSINIALTNETTITLTIRRGFSTPLLIPNRYTFQSVIRKG